MSLTGFSRRSSRMNPTPVDIYLTSVRHRMSDKVSGKLKFVVDFGESSIGRNWNDKLKFVGHLSSSMECSVKRSLLVLLLFACLLAPSTTFASLQGIPKGAPARPGSPPATAARLPEKNLVSQLLPNGLEIIILEDHSIPLVTIELAVKNGSYTEPPELNGLSHLYEHMFFKQNRAVANAEDYLRFIGQMGIAYNGSTREEVVNYYFTTTSPNIRTAMQFMKDAARYPLFEEGEFVA